MLLRRGVAAAAASSSSSSSRILFASSCCCSARQSISTSSRVYRVPSKSSGSRFGSDSDRRFGADSDRSNSNRNSTGFQKVWPRQKVDYGGFALPEPPTGQEVARKLIDQCKTMLIVQDPEKPEEALGARLVAYGLTGRAAEMLLYSSSRNKETLGSYAPADDAENLFKIWKREAARVLPRLGLAYDAKHLNGAENTQPPSAETTPSTSDDQASIEKERTENEPTEDELTQNEQTDQLLRERVAFASIEDAVLSYTIEGDSCLTRHCFSAFLDWVEAGLEQLLDPTASFRATNSPDRFEINIAKEQLRLLRKTTDLRNPVHRYQVARSLTRQIHLHVGPTNSGKTHGALVALSKARTGVFAGPLRLLAHEVWDRFNFGTISPGVPPRACNLITGEEQRIVAADAGLQSCTVEMVNTQDAVDVAVVDEIQMIGDPQRGFAWTDVVLGVPAKEVHLCGEASTIPLITRMAADCGDVLHVHEYKRLTPLVVAKESLKDDLSQIKPGDCMVVFSRSGIFALKREIEQKTGLRCAVAYGALPPETKADQAKLFNEGKLDVMVASDAIGMGLNLKIKRVIFDSMSKWNGKEQVSLSASQIKQIAGRAGRYGTKRDADEVDGGVVTTRHEDELDVLRQALDSPLRPVDRAALQPSSETLATLAALLPPALPPHRDVNKVQDLAAGPTAYSKMAYKKAKKRNTAMRMQNSKREEQRILKAMQGPGFRTLSEIYTDVSMLSRIQSATYFMSDFSQQHQISPVVEEASNSLLSVAERESLANAPCNTRDPRLMTFLHHAVRIFSIGGLARFDECAQESGMLEVEQLLLKSMQEARELRAAESPSDADTEEKPLASYLGQNHELINVATLMVLESLHRSMSLYLWLSFRFPVAFCYRDSVEQRKRVVEEGIEFVLEGVRFGRARRLRALGRDSEADMILQKPGWKDLLSPPQPRHSQ